MWTEFGWHRPRKRNSFPTTCFATVSLKLPLPPGNELRYAPVPSGKFATRGPNSIPNDRFGTSVPKLAVTALGPFAVTELESANNRLEGLRTLTVDQRSIVSGPVAKLRAEETSLSVMRTRATADVASLEVVGSYVAGEAAECGGRRIAADPRRAAQGVLPRYAGPERSQREHAVQQASGELSNRALSACRHHETQRNPLPRALGRRRPVERVRVAAHQVV